jgi:DNA-binding MarR family transcriptional regulator
MSSEEQRFADLLSRVAREVTSRETSEVCCGDLTLEQFRTLRAVDSAQASSIGTLSNQLRVDLSTMSRNVALLERNDYLIRAKSAEDGRIVNVRLTAKGRRALETLRCGEQEVFGDLYARLAVKERSRVIKALGVLLTCFEQAVPAEACCPPKAKRKSP